jgi:hypothetical protein
MSLGTLVLAALFADLLLWVLLLTGIEHFAIKPGITVTNALDLYDYPISHSLATDAVWGALLATPYYLVRKDRRASLVIFAAVLSHWLLDVIAHRTDMPLAPNIRKYYGLGLYNSRPGMIAVEGLIWLGGIVIYLRATRAEKRFGTYVFWIGAAVLTWLWLVRFKGLAPPGSMVKTAISSLVFMLLTVAWAHWVDGLRSSRASAQNIESSAHPAG